MGSRIHTWLPGLLMVGLAAGAAHAQVFVVGETTATKGLGTEFHPTDVKLETAKLTELGRRELIRDFEAEQGFAFRALPLGGTLTLHANGPLKPGGEDYRALIYRNGTAVVAGERVAITRLTFKGNSIIFDFNGGPTLPHNILRHLDVQGMSMANSDKDRATGSRLTLVFDKYIPDITGDQVKQLIGGIIDFNARTGERAYAETLPPKIRAAVKAHEPLVGMDHKMVLAAMGQPVNKVREQDDKDAPEYEEWIYGEPPATVRFVRFVGDRVTMIKVAERGKSIIVRNQDETDGEVAPVPVRVIALGDQDPHVDKGGTATPPTLRDPNDPDDPMTQTTMGTLKKVQFPNQNPDQKPDQPATPPMTEKTGLPSLGSAAPVPAAPADPNKPE